MTTSSIGNIFRGTGPLWGERHRAHYGVTVMIMQAPFPYLCLRIIAVYLGLLQYDSKKAVQLLKQYASEP